MAINLDKNEIIRILIVKIAAIGDLLLITPAVRVIRKNFPDARITLLVGRWSRPIIEGNPNIDEIIEVPDEIFFKFRPFSLLGLIFQLRKRRFDLVFIWHRSLAFRLFLRLLGIKNRAGFSRRGNHWFLTRWAEENPDIHEIYEYQSTLKPLGIETAEIDMEITLADSDRDFADKLWSDHRLAGERVVAIAPGGGKNPKEVVPLKHWPKEYYARLADMLIERFGVNIVFLGNKDDSAIIFCILSMMKSEATDLSGQTNLKQMAAVIEKSALFIGNDSAPMHIAAAVRTPVVSIFGPTNPNELAPLNYRHKYLFAAEKCNPCYQNGKFPECVAKECMKSIKPEKVLVAAEELLK